MLRIPAAGLRQGCTVKLLELLGELPRKHDLTRTAEGSRKLFQKRAQPMRRFIKKQSLLPKTNIRQNLAALLLCLWQKTEETESRRIKTRANECRQSCISPRQRYHADTGPDGEHRQMAARIGYARKPCVTHAYQRASALQIFDQLRPLRELVVLMVACERRMDIVMCQQLARMARILCRNQPGLTENADRAIGHILKIADGRRT